MVRDPDPEIRALAEREITRRHSLAIEAADRLATADSLLDQGQTEAGLEELERAYRTCPDAPAFDNQRQILKRRLDRALTQRAEELARRGRRAEARHLLNRVTAD